MSIKPWILAFRLRTLPLAISSISMGAFLAASEDKFRLSIFLWATLTTIFLQILSNLANDYGDSISGIDSAARKGPQRAVQLGLISKEKMRAAIILFTVLSLVSGIILLFVAFGWQWRTLLFFLALGLLSISAAITYTVGKKPYGYVGLGDASVFVFFGVIGVIGSYYLFTQKINTQVIFPAISSGVFAVGVLNINNIRDINSDKEAGKYSIPVRIGKHKAALYQIGLLIMGIITSIIYVLITEFHPLKFIFLLTIPLFYSIGKAVRTESSEKLDPYLKKMALTTLLFVLLFGIGLLLAN